VTVPSKSRIRLLTDDIRDYLGEIEADYKLAHDLAHEVVRRGSDRISGGGVSDPTGEVAVSRQRLKGQLRLYATRLQKIQAETLALRNDLNAALLKSEVGAPPDDRVEFPRIITKAERDQIHQDREKAMNRSGR
jgi:hypothetical protein